MVSGAVNRFLNESKESPSLQTLDERMVWEQKTEKVNFCHIENDEWHERGFDRSLRRKLTEVSRTPDYVELKVENSSSHIRLFRDRREVLVNGNWKRVSDGIWKNDSNIAAIARGIHQPEGRFVWHNRVNFSKFCFIENGQWRELEYDGRSRGGLCEVSRSSDLIELTWGDKNGKVSVKLFGKGNNTRFAYAK